MIFRIFSYFSLVLTAFGMDSDTAFQSLEKVSLGYYDLAAPFVGTEFINNRRYLAKSVKFYDLFSNWAFGEDAIVEVNRQVRLTSDVQSQQGWLWSRIPLDANSFAIEFEFTVNYKGGLSGDGFAFWITSESEKTGSTFGNEDHFNGLGVFFDTYANSRHTYPYIMAMLGDGKTKYDHDFDGNTEELGGCAAEFRNKGGSTTIRITNIHKKYFKLEYKTPDIQSFAHCFTISVTLPEKRFIGFSAMTGGVSSEHAIQNVRAWNILKADTVKDEIVTNKQTSTSKPTKLKNSSSSGWSFLTWFLILLVLCILGYAGWVYQKTSKQHSYKRF